MICSVPPTLLQDQMDSYKLYKNFCQLNCRKYFFLQRIINDWNNLPQGVMANQIMYGLFKFDSYILETIQIFIYT